MPGQVVGRKGKSRQIADTQPINRWNTDVVDGKDPDFAYQFFHNDQVADKLRPSRVALNDYENGTSQTHTIPAWEIVRRDISGEEAAGFRPDEGKPLDSVLRHGPMVCLKLPKAAWELLQAAQEQRADAYETRLRGGHSEQYDQNGQATSVRAGRLASGSVRLTEQPLERI